MFHVGGKVQQTAGFMSARQPVIYAFCLMSDIILMRTHTRTRSPFLLNGRGLYES